jgi:branched-chain amino acid aminotransferase
MSLLWINGHLIDKSDARVSPFDHGFLYGDGVWEPLRVFNGQLFLPAEHLNRLFDSAAALGIDIPLSRDELTAAIETTVKANERTEGYVRVIVTRGAGTLGPDPRKLDSTVIVIAEEYQPFPRELYPHGLHVAVFPVPLDAENPTHAARTLGQSHLVLAKQHALQNGCLEAVLKNREARLVGTTEGFLFLVKDGAVVVASGQPTEATGFAVAAMAGNAGLVVAKYSVKLDDLLTADEAFIAGTSCGVIGIVRVDGKDIGAGPEGPNTRALRERFHDLTRGRSE